MKKLKLALLLTLTLQSAARAEPARFFRVAGPVASTITAFRADGSVTWTNAPTNATFTVQTAFSLVGPSNWVDYLQVPATNAATTSRLFDPNPPAGMALIPAGSFTMGDSVDGDPYAVPLHTAQISAFYMDKYAVTKAQWDDVYQWATNHGYSFESGHWAQGKTNNHPAQTLSWYDAVLWCNARSEKEGRVPAYYTNTAQTVVYRIGNAVQIDLQNDWVNWSSGYRLPTEAEREKAARGGASKPRFSWGNTINQSQANYYSLWSGGLPIYAYDVNPTNGSPPAFNVGPPPWTSPVGYFAPNGYGLYDMTGNVFEWCWDWHGAYSGDSQTDPRGPTTGAGRAFRGGSWSYGANYCRTGIRNGDSPEGRRGDLGFRCVRAAGP